MSDDDDKTPLPWLSIAGAITLLLLLLAGCLIGAAVMEALR